MSGSTAIQSNFSSHSDNGVGQKSTHSVWIKRTDPSGDTRSTIISGMNGSAGYMKVRFADDDRLMAYGTNSSGTNCDVQTKRNFRDVMGWIHVVLQIDTSAGTASDRVKWYVNGELQELHGTPTYPSQGDRNHLTTADDLEIGRNAHADDEHFDGYMSHFHCTDGYLTAPSVFGSTDSVTGEWKVNSSPTVANYGTYGYWIFKDGTNLSGSTVQDQSGQGNNFTVTQGTLTPTHDNPSNIFCTLNSVTGMSSPTFSNGNLKTTSSSDNQRISGTIPSKAGYYEVKLGTAPVGASGKGLAFGVTDVTNYNETNNWNITATRLMRTNYAYDAHYSTENFGGGNSWENVTTGVTASSGHIIMVAWKNGKVYYGYNGTWFFSANPSNNTDGSTQVPLADTNAYQLPIFKSNITGADNAEFNFGNGYFGTTAVSSNSGNGYQDSNGQGKFYYQPPTGTYACCTKNLNI